MQPTGLLSVRPRSGAGVRLVAWGRTGKPVWGRVGPLGPVRLRLVPVTYEAGPGVPPPAWGQSRCPHAHMERVPVDPGARGADPGDPPQPGGGAPFSRVPVPLGPVPVCVPRPMAVAPFPLVPVPVPPPRPGRGSRSSSPQ